MSIYLRNVDFEELNHHFDSIRCREGDKIDAALLVYRIKNENSDEHAYAVGRTKFSIEDMAEIVGVLVNALNSEVAVKTEMEGWTPGMKIGQIYEYSPELPPS
ncbi:hypothetical protein [Dendrosporobacter sp. 1207_IL3150]|uniref:hypothetical protein n=1 Tax=Dendrosporobacter sp. 1207_IL3150 TaxID=3084054 RepID=UPI002FDA8B6F